MKSWPKPIFNWNVLAHGILCFVVQLSTGCSDVPKAYQVENNSSPSLRDEDVRFRTTYFLRVFDTCRLDEDGSRAGDYEPRMGAFTSRVRGSFRIVKDSVYRIRMTGQASALFNNIRFESGLLKANQIDPFTRGITFEETRNKLDIRKNEVSAVIPGTHPEQPPQMSESNGSSLCPDGSPAQTGFHLLGPEGVRILEPEDRLVMAMSSDAQPLIAALERLSVQRAADTGLAIPTYEFNLARRQVSKALSRLTNARKELRLSTDPLKRWNPLVLGDNIREDLSEVSNEALNEGLRRDE